MASKISPNRRRSIAVLDQGQASRHRGRRRAYSIAPGEKLSPSAKRRRTLAPRKSILKTTLNLPGSADASAAVDETTSMDLTEVHPQSRKSLARRVSFASHLHVRLIDGKDDKKSRDPQSSSPDPPTRNNDDDSDNNNDDDNEENRNPVHTASRRRSSIRRRSSTGFSEFGERSMDMDNDDDAPLPADFFQQNDYQPGGSAMEDDEFTDDDEDEDDMEITEAIRLNIERKRSLSLGGPAHASLPSRRRSSIAPTTVTQGRSENQPPPPRLPPPPDGDLSEVQEEGDMSMSSENAQSFATEGSSMEETKPIEYTAPLGKSLRPQKRPSAAWLALQAITHAGIPEDESIQEEDEDGDSGIYQESEPMELTDAMSRIMKARVSLGMSPGSGNADTTVSDMDEETALQENSFQDDSFTSTEDSFAGDIGDRTVNMTTIVRTSFGTQDSLMDTAPPGGMTDEDRPIRLPLTPAPAPAPAPALAPQTISPPNPTAAPNPTPALQFAAPTPAPQPFLSSVFSASTLRPPVFAPPPKTPAPPPQSPAKPPPSATPLPDTRASADPRPPAPTKAPIPTTNAPRSPAVQRPSAAFAPPAARKSPAKRPAPPASEAAHPPSPAKRVAIGRLEPAKIAPFERAASQEPTGTRRTSMVRRPSGYFAQRKSFGAGMLPPALPGAARSPKKAVSGLGFGRARASMGAPPSSEGSGLFGVRETGGSLYPDVSRIAEEDPPTPTRANSAPPESPSRCEREEFRQAIATPSPTRGSPAPASPRAGSPSAMGRLLGFQRPVSPALQASPAVGRPQPAAPSPRPASPAPAAPSVEAGLRDTGITLARPSATEPPVESAVTEQWRAGVGGDDIGYDEEPPISIEQFFNMTGIRFMDELTMPKPRQSVVPPPHLRTRGRRRSSAEFSEAEEDPIPLAEFAVAMAAELPRLELLTAVANDLSAWIEESKKICAEAERETEKVTPELFRDFVAADESEKGLLIHQLKLIKAHNYGTAKSQWYDWKIDWMQRLDARAQQEFANLESDAQALAKIIEQAQTTLPNLREEYAQIMAELEQEQADVAEIENSDQDYLSELKATITEQSSELEVFRTDVSESRAKLDRLNEKLAEIEEQKQEATAAIARANYNAHIQKESTTSAVFRLKDELEALQDLHLWRATKISPTMIQFIYASRYEVSIPCMMHEPILADVTISKVKDLRLKERDHFPSFTTLALQAAQQMMIESDGPLNIRQIVDRLGDFWCACSQIRSQFTFLAIKWPLSVEVSSEEQNTLPDLHAKATILFPKAHGKAIITFIFDRATYIAWPFSIKSLQTEVEVKYGQIERQTILDAILGRLAQVTPTDSHGCLLDACIEAVEQCE
ncbi:Spc7 kinetochore protein-domain-containing protein [Fomitopsis betulina]|nr:Spc7 kinetochore protein-domain-containing protein [Fomitopsis betulina]